MPSAFSPNGSACADAASFQTDVHPDHRPLLARRVRRRAASRGLRGAAPHEPGLLAGHAGRAGLLGGAEARRRRARRPRAEAVLGQRGRDHARGRRSRAPGEDAQHAAGDGPAAARRLPPAAAAQLQGQGHRRPRGSHPSDLSADLRPGRRRRRRVRPRRHVEPAVAGDRRAGRPPGGGLAEDPPLGRDEHLRPGPRRQPARRRRRRRRPTPIMEMAMYAIEFAARRRRRSRARISPR